MPGKGVIEFGGVSGSGIWYPESGIQYPNFPITGKQGILIRLMMNDIFIFFTGCLFMAMLYHFVLFLIQKDNILLHYTAYLFAATLFLAERVWVEGDFRAEDQTKAFYYDLFDEPIQLLIYITYFRFVTRALKVFESPDRKFITVFRLVQWTMMIFAIYHIIGFSLGWFEQRSMWAFIAVRVIMVVMCIIMFLNVSKYITGTFFKFIIAGSLIMLVGGLLAFLTSVFHFRVLGMAGVYWSCFSLVLDVICFSAALGYKAKRDTIEKQAALKELFAKENQLKLQELEKINAVYQARDADRNRIARDLHDEIGSTLSSIHIYSAVAEKTMSSEPEKTKKVLEQINVNTRMVMDSMSDIIWAMKTGDHEKTDLSNKIKNLGFDLLDAKNIKCSYEIHPDADKADLDIDMRRNILLIVKESLNNVMKYSGATEVKLTINLHGGCLFLEIEDNGTGFNIQNAHKGNGLQNMNYRVKKYGGSFRIISGSNGTSINCSFPLTIIRDEINLTDV